jgi:3-dehydroquinate synthase/3-phosphoshikimate 1-carboxyvinyltransferase
MPSYEAMDEKRIFEDYKGARILIVTDDNIYRHHSDRFQTCEFLVLPPGESSKNFDTYTKIIDRLADLRMNRSDVLCALGGGVIGDLAGFAASTYMRGMEFVQIPTTLLAMVDSSVGGKTGINHKSAKNRVGTFYEASNIYRDPTFLYTLPREEFANGFSEIIKYAIGFNPDLGDMLDRIHMDSLMDPDQMNLIMEIVEICVEIKQSVVRQDEKDKGIRQLLNFGHTIGHAIEAYYDYEGVSHGQAVAIGMSMKLKLAYDENIISAEEYHQWMKRILKFGLPVTLDHNNDLCKILEHMVFDKKATGKNIRWIEIQKIGELKVVEDGMDVWMKKLDCVKEAFNVIVEPNKLKGTVTIPPSKSLSHRAIICAGLSEQVSVIGPVSESVDIQATLAAMTRFGAEIVRVKSDRLGDYYQISNKKIGTYYETRKPVIHEPLTIDCHESGSTLRFLIPFAFLTSANVTFTGEGRLVKRPLTPYYDLFDQKGVKYETRSGELPLTIHGNFGPGRYELPGNVSSQFITGLLMTLPLMNDDSEIHITTDLESGPYIDLTIETLKQFSIDIEHSSENVYHIPGNQSYSAVDLSLEGDYSQGAFWLVANSLGSEVDVTGLEPLSLQGDRIITSMIDIFDLEPHENSKREFDISQCPDLLPILAVKAALTKGITVFEKGERVRLKESDRIHAMAVELGKMGADIVETDDGLKIVGVEQLKSATVSSWNDHRIAMALAIAATCSSGPVCIEGADCVSKSYPEFWEDYKKVGGDFDVKPIWKTI